MAMPFNPLTAIAAGSALLGATKAPPAGPSISGDISTNLLWQSPFLVGTNGSSADVSGSQSATQAGSGGYAQQPGGAAQSLQSLGLPIVVILGAVVVAVALARR
jgi:hypothetical protein